jgi:hypothetical protein
MANIDAFPTMHDVLIAGDNVQDFTAGSTIHAGQVVSMATDGFIDPTADLPVLGVALYDAQEADHVAVACVGCEVNVANSDKSTAIEEGVQVIAKNDTIDGAVLVATAVSTGSGANMTVTAEYVVGVTLEPIAGDGTGKVLLMPSVNTCIALSS